MNKEILQKRSKLIAEFLHQAKPKVMECESLMLEDEMFYDVRIKYVDMIQIGSKSIMLDTPRWFVQFSREHREWQLEITYQE